MKVLVIGINYAPEVTGIAPYTTSLTRRLASEGHEVKVITARPHYPEWAVHRGYEGRGRTEVREGVSVRRVRHYVPSAPRGLRRLLSELTFGVQTVRARWGGCDVILFVSPALFATALGLVKARLLRPATPTVVWVQDLYSRGVQELGEARGGLLSSAMAAVEGAVLRLAGSVVVIHDRFAATVRELGVRAESIKVVRNWVHLGPAPTADPLETRAALGCLPGETLAVHTGNMGAKQDLGNVVEAARLADEKGLPVRFLLIGDGARRRELERLSEGCSRVSILPPLPNARFQAVLAAADVLLVNEAPGLRETALPSKLTSYFAAGRPVIAATDRDSITAAESAESGAGVRVDPGSPDELLHAVLELRARPATAEELGRAGADYHLRALSPAASVVRLTALLEELAHGITSARPAPAGSRPL